ncbi:MAG: hypothetical protein IRY95_05020, partial [Clostridia bacterium]|nr:hypothetical protein [Clostridia bacterium]
GYLGTQVQATGVIMNVVFGTGYVTGLIIGLGVLAAYTIIGGMVAGVYTDVFQGAIMVLASIAIFIYVLVNGGGFLNIQQQLVAADPRMVSPWGLVPALTCLSWFFLFAVGSSGQPQFLHKFYMSKGIETLRWGGLLAGLAYMMTTFLAMGLGMGMRALVQSGAAPALKSPDQAVPTYLLHYTPDVLAGVVFAGLLAAIMSTGDAFVNIGAACIVRDIPRSFGRKVRNELLWGRVWTLVLFLVSTAFALYMNTLVALLGTFGWATFAAALVPVLGIGLSWRRATAPAAIVTLIVSLALNFGLELLSRYKIYKLPHGMVNGALILAVSVVLFVVLSVLTRPRELEPDVAAALDA